MTEPAAQNTPAPQLTVLSGTVSRNLETDSNWALATGNGVRTFKEYQSFNPDFTKGLGDENSPTVIVAISGFDLINSSKNPTNYRLKAYVENPTKEGFTLVIETWGDTRVYGASVSYVAYGRR